MLGLPDYVSRKCSKAVIVSGAARSGTTILGKLIHSFRGVEYSFEPPLLFSLYPLIESLKESEWRFLYETYLYEDFLVPALAGRNLNFNNNDDSSIFKVKSKSEIENRISKSWRKTEIEEEVLSDALISYKMPDIIPFLSRFNSYYPNSKILIVVREPLHIINSLLNKNWYSNSSLNLSNSLWPCRKFNDLKVPFWVREGHDEFWCNSSEIDRLIYYLKVQYMSISSNANIIEYSELLNNPYIVTNKICELLGLNFGQKTEEVISSIKPQGTKLRQFDDEIVKKCNEVQEIFRSIKSSMI